MNCFATVFALGAFTLFMLFTSVRSFSAMIFGLQKCMEIPSRKKSTSMKHLSRVASEIAAEIKNWRSCLTLTGSQLNAFKGGAGLRLLPGWFDLVAKPQPAENVVQHSCRHRSPLLQAPRSA